MNPHRCGRSISDPLYIGYHDKEWGTPVHDDRKLFEMLILEGSQAGLSWVTILRKRENYRRAFLAVQQEFGSFDRYIWQFVGGEPRVNRWRTVKQIPPKTRESDAMSRDLKDRGFKFVGSTICYAFMQAVGMVNDHIASCCRYRELS